MPKAVSEPIELYTSVQPETEGYTCPKTGHLVPLEKMPTGTPIKGTYRLFGDDGRTLATGRLEDLEVPPTVINDADAGTADAQANSEEAQ